MKIHREVEPRDEITAYPPQSLLRPKDRRNARSSSQPTAIAFKRDAKLGVVNCQIAVAITRDGRGCDALYVLSDDAHIGFVAAIVAEAVEAEAVVEIAEKDNVVLQADIGTASAASATTAAAATASVGAHPATSLCTRRPAMAAGPSGSAMVASPAARPTAVRIATICFRAGLVVAAPA